MSIYQELSWNWSNYHSFYLKSNTKTVFGLWNIRKFLKQTSAYYVSSKVIKLNNSHGILIKAVFELRFRFERLQITTPLIGVSEPKILRNESQHHPSKMSELWCFYSMLICGSSDGCSLPALLFIQFYVCYSKWQWQYSKW